MTTETDYQTPPNTQAVDEAVFFNHYLTDTATDIIDGVNLTYTGNYYVIRNRYNLYSFYIQHIVETSRGCTRFYNWDTRKKNCPFLWVVSEFEMSNLGDSGSLML